MITTELERFKDIIFNTTILKDKIDNQISEFRAKITFIDYSVLEFSEILVLGINKRKYSFQWMNKDNDLIIRWDNALHHRHISTFPHHKHVGVESNIQPAEELVLTDVLLIISESNPQNLIS
jgi:hypothetical protein